MPLVSAPPGPGPGNPPGLADRGVTYGCTFLFHLLLHLPLGLPARNGACDGPLWYVMDEKTTQLPALIGIATVARHLGVTERHKAGIRRVTLPAPLVVELQEHLARHGRPDPDGYVFVSPEGLPLERNNLRGRVWLPATQCLRARGPPLS